MPKKQFSRKLRRPLFSGSHQPVQLRDAAAHLLPRKAAAFLDAFKVANSGKGVACLYGNYSGDNMGVGSQTYPTRPSGTISASPPTFVTTIGTQNW